MKKILAIICLIGAFAAPAQIPNLDAGWQVNRSNVQRIIYTSPRGRWGIVFGVTNVPALPTAPALPGAFNVWPVINTNIYANTNGRVMEYYSTNGFTGPTTAPVTVRNTNSLIYGAQGFTAITVHNTLTGPEPAFGQIQGTALTKRHVIVRGHHLGATGNIGTNGSMQMWWVTSSNTSIARTVQGGIGFDSSVGAPFRDYTLLLLSSDLPDSIEPVSIIRWSDFLIYLPLTNRFHLFFSCQHNKLSTLYESSLGGFTHNSYVGGDSGSPNFVLLPHPTRRFRLALYGITSGSRWYDDMTASLNNLTVWGGLNTNSYQPDFVDLSDYLP
jgi:hypothetical protein